MRRVQTGAEAVGGLIDPDTVVLHRGSHHSPEEGHSLLEAVALFAGEPMSDAPACVCPTLQRFTRAWNDAIEDDGERTRQLRPYVTALVGTAGSQDDADRRAWKALDWLVRVSAPMWLEVAGDRRRADRLRELPEINRHDGTVLDVLRRTSPAEEARWDGARYKAWAAARRAAGDAAWDAAWAAARYAARDEVWDLAGDTAKEAAWSAAWPAALAASGEASDELLQRVVESLQRSAHQLLLDMIEAGPHYPVVLAEARHEVLTELRKRG